VVGDQDMSEEAMGKKEIFLSSIVIAAFNNESTILACIESLSRQNLNDAQITVVDDGSKDRTAEIAKRAGAEVISLATNHGSSYALNRGIDKAAGQYVFTLDADAQVPPLMIPKAIEVLRGSGCDVVGGTYIANSRGGRIGELYELYRRVFHTPSKPTVYTGNQDPKVYGTFIGFRREALRDERFDENLRAAYDRELLCRLARKGYRILYSPEVYVYHPSPSSLSSIIRRVWTMGIWTSVVGKKYLGLIKNRLTLASLAVLMLGLAGFDYVIVLPTAIVAHYLMFVAVSLLQKKVNIKFLQALTVGALAVFISMVDVTSLLGFLFSRPKHWK